MKRVKRIQSKRHEAAIKAMEQARSIHFKKVVPKPQPNIYFNLARSMLERYDIALKYGRMEYCDGLVQNLEKYPEVKVFFDKMKVVREHPEKAKSLIQDCKQARKKSPAYRSEEDIVALELFKAAFGNEQQETLSQSVKDIFSQEAHSVEFGGGRFGGAGASGGWDTDNVRDTTHHHSPSSHDHHDTYDYGDNSPSCD
jgi:uncharacterized membrane protein YgcG